MPAVQTAYSATIANGFPGMIANGETSNRISRTVEDAAGIAFGKAAFRGTGDHGVTATPTAGALMGIVIADHGVQVATSAAAADTIPQYGSAALLTLGSIWVTAGASTTDGAQAYVTPGGVFTPTSTSNVILPGWFFDDTVSSGAVVRIVRR